MSKKALNFGGKAYKLAILAAALAMAMIVSYVESLVPTSLLFPGFKMGFANAVIIIILRSFGFKYALCVNFCRWILSALLFGSVFSFSLSLAGGLAALIVQFLLLKAPGLSLASVSAAGGAVHNAGQCAAAAVIFSGSGLLGLLPLLLILGMLTGILCGICAAYCDNLLRKHRFLT